MKEISIIIPSRNRPEQLRRLLHSLRASTRDPGDIEILLAIDNDEPEYEDYVMIANQPKFCDFRMIVVNRTECFPEYYNELARLSKGKILWVLNDDCLVDKKDWDTIVRWEAEEFAEVQSHNIWYGDVGDTTRNYNNNGQYSCFPMMSREAFNVLGYFFNPQIIAWGTDKYLKHVFEQAGAGIINLTDIVVEHAHVQDDETHTVLINRLKSHAGQECSVNYQPDIERLREACQS